MGHALLAPSANHRWTECTAAPRASEGLDGGTSIHAWRGTVLHGLAEDQFHDMSMPAPGTEYVCPDDGSIVYTLTADDLDLVDQYVDKVKSQVLPGDVLIIEDKIDMSHFVPESSGTSDVVLIRPLVGIKIIDAKFGTGIKVEGDSKQLGQYLIGAYDKYKDEYMLPNDNLTAEIIQPGLDHVSTYDYTHTELELLRALLSEKGKEAHIGAPVAKFKAGDWCRFCPRKPTCPHLQETMRDRVADVFGPSPEEKAKSIETDTLAEELRMIPAMREYIKAIEDRAMDMATSGEKIPGYKLVEGRRGNKQWIDKDKVEETLRKKKVKVSDMYTQTLKSPTQMAKVTDIDLSVFVTQSAGKPTLVPETDRRKEITPADLVFDKVS